MFMLGANDGYYPKESAGLGIIATTELESLAEQGIEFFPDNAESNKLNKFYITQLFARAKEKVFVTFNNELGEQSVLVTQLQRILNIPIEMALGDGNQKSMEIAEYASKIGTKRNAKQEMAIYYGERMNGINEGEEKIFDYLFSCLEGEFNYQNLIKSKNNKAVKPNTLAWSKSGNQTFARISAVEGYFNCPFKFFCENTLKLKDNEKGDLSVALIGSFVHKVMELFFADNSNLGLEGEELRLFVLNLCECIIKEKDFEYIAYAYSKKTLENTLFKKACYLVDKIAQVAKRSDFKTCATELSFGLKNSKLPAYELKASDGKSYFFRGEIDRVDSYGNYVALLDYKSKSGMNYGLKEIYYGERVQLLIYLNAYMANFDQEPFALLYMPMPYKYDKYEKEKKPFQYVGLVRNMEDAIEHFDREYKGKSQVLPLKLKKDGSLDDKNLLSKEQLDILREYADKVTAQAIEEIENGYIEAKPKSCNYCKFGAICGAKNNPLKARKTNGSVDFEKGTTCD